MNRQVLRNARVFDSVTGQVSAPSTIVVTDGRVDAVLHAAAQAPAGVETDLGGRIVLPGLIDCHVHVMAVHHDVWQLSMQPPTYITAQATHVLEGMLMRGFTTVRDAAGADYGVQLAIERGFLRGPRLFIAGAPLSQTGGHADIRPRGVKEFICTCAGVGLFPALADGVPEVRRAVREQLRLGANQIKIMAGGGVASPTDPIDGTQYSLEELTAICEETTAANTYAMAHAYSPRSITRAVQCGVRTIEHGNLLDDASAKMMKQHGAFLVPTLATYSVLGDEGQRLKWSDEMLAKLDRVKDAGTRAIAIAKAAGVPIAFGTDLLGTMHPQQAREWRLRADVQTPVEQLQSATSVAATVLNQTGLLGVIAPGAHADLIVVDGDPTVDISIMCEPEKNFVGIMKAGKWEKPFAL
ncbi:MAG: amidohydrolase family protein [Burkholderiales bacterium]|nr:amidohydrolase family protein [Burkholderiales bacterium]